MGIGPEDDFEALSSSLPRWAASCWCARSTSSARAAGQFAEQDDDAATYAAKVRPGGAQAGPRPSGGRSWPGSSAPSPPTSAAYLETGGGERLGVRKARPVDVGVKTGEIRAEWGGAAARLRPGALRLEVVQPPGGKPMAADAYCAATRCRKLP